MVSKKIRVLVIDDSIVSQEIISKGIATESLIEIVGVASDPFEGRDKILELAPDVLTLDINMPKMDGISFLKKLMAQYPIPVIVISSSKESVFEALNAGAVEFVAKPEIRKPEDLHDFIHEVIGKIKIAAISKATRTNGLSHKSTPHLSGDTSNVNIIAIGASTGGTDAILAVLKNIPSNIPGIVIVQHMPAVFTRMYAERLDRECIINVKEAKTGDEIKSGCALIAPGGYQMKVYKDKGRYFVRCSKDEKVNGHCPSVDVLFNSVAETCENKSIGVILTGMGSDGAKGLLNMRRKGAYTIGQNKDTCVVYGMPMVSYNIGAVMKQLALEKISEDICAYIKAK